MPRYIDAEALISKLQEKIKVFDERIERRNGPCYHDESSRTDALNNRALAYEETIRMLRDAPTATVESVVHCEECQFANHGKLHAVNFICNRFKTGEFTHIVKPNGFCSYGKRKDGGER